MLLTNYHHRADSTTFYTSAENFESLEQIRPGRVVSFSYDTYSRNSIPINPHNFRARYDVSWEDVIQDYALEASLSENELKGTPPSQELKLTSQQNSPKRLFMDLR